MENGTKKFIRYLHVSSCLHVKSALVRYIVSHNPIVRLTICGTHNMWLLSCLSFSHRLVMQHTQQVQSVWLFREIIAHLVFSCGINSLWPSESAIWRYKSGPDACMIFLYHCESVMKIDIWIHIFEICTIFVKCRIYVIGRGYRIAEFVSFEQTFHNLEVRHIVTDFHIQMSSVCPRERTIAKVYYLITQPIYIWLSPCTQ